MQITKRFTAFLVTALLLIVAFMFAIKTNSATAFGEFALYLSGAYGAYCTGQSATDYISTKVSSPDAK